MSIVLTEIHQRIASMTASANIANTDVLPPLLLLGTSERVGSNWLSDTLRPSMAQHNEPFRQQLGPTHPLSSINPNGIDIEQLADGQLGLLGLHALVEFVAAKHAPERHVLKETNLFFAVRSLLRLFPEAPIVVLSRSPVGVASSFKRSNLFARWGYTDRYEQMVTMTMAGPHRRFAPLVPAGDFDELTTLTRLIVLNTILLADALDEREHRHIQYEAAVLDNTHVHTALNGLVPHSRLPLPEPGAVPRAAGDDLFATTNHKASLTANLTADEAVKVTERTAETLTAAKDCVPASALRRAAQWLTGAEQYHLANQPRVAGQRTSIQTRSPIPDVTWMNLRRMVVRNLLCSNAEFCRMLNALLAAGLANTHLGTHLLLMPMPHERGGRIHWSDKSQEWAVSAGYEHHPAYWVTWIGAAAFAAVNGALLPEHRLMRALSSDARPTNHGYKVGDVVHVGSDDPAHGVHHLVGNVQVWCRDGPRDEFGQPVQRWVHGAAWNTPPTLREINRLRSRHLLGASRSTGIRLVADTAGPRPGQTINHVATLLGQWIESLSDRTQSLADLDMTVVKGLQADVAFRSHV